MKGAALAEMLSSDSNLNRLIYLNKHYIITIFINVCIAIISLFFHASPVFSQPALTDRHQIARIDVEGLASISKEELIYLLDIKIGEPLDKDKLQTGIKRAFLKGIFDDIIVESLDNADTLIRITVKEKRLINKIRITGNNYFSARFIKKAAALVKGERLSDSRLKKAMESVIAELRVRGFENSQANYSIIPVKNNRVDITINVAEGSPSIIKKIIITDQDNIVKSYLRLSDGDIFDRNEMQRLEKKISDHYRKENIIGAKLSYSYDKGILNIKLDAGKRLTISFTGSTIFSAKTLLNEMPFFELNEFSGDLVEVSTARIINLYHKYGYQFAQIAPAISTLDNNISLEFFIFEGTKYKVKSITFSNIDPSAELTIPHDSLRNILVLRENGNFNPAVLESDIETIQEFYNALGYLYAKVQDIDINTEVSDVELKFLINEGPKIKLSTISVTGNLSISEKDLLNAIKIRAGDPYNEMDIAEARRKIVETYNKKGFSEATVAVRTDIENMSADIKFSVQEGDAFLFGKHIITGNEYTKWPVIKREFLHSENESYDYNVLLDERRNLYRLGLFTDIEIEPAEIAGNKKDILYKLKEGKSGAVELGIGYGEYEGYRGFLDVSYKNLWGMNRLGSLRTEISSLEERLILTYHEPWFLDRKLTFKSLFLLENKKEKNLDDNETRYSLRRISASAGIEKILNDDVKAEIYYDISQVKILDIMPGAVLSKEDTGTLLISGIRPALIYDTRDNPFEPRSGILAGISLKIASFVLFSETDYARLTFYANKYQKLNKRMVFALSLRGGIAEGFMDTKELPIVERFYLGGRTTVRGYAQDTLGPKSADGTPTGGNAFAMGNFELRSDVWRGFGIVAFVDAGNVWQRSKDIDITDLKYTTGLGLRYNTPVGPFRIDYGHKLSKETGESSGEIHFSLGHAF